MARKKSKVKAKPRVKKGGKLAGPSFEGWENWTGAAFNSFRNNAHAFYYENYKPADLLSSVWSWMKNNDYTREQIKQAKAGQAQGNYISTAKSIYCKLIEDGCPNYNPEHQNYWESMPGCVGEIKPLSTYIRDSVEQAIAVGKTIVEEENREQDQPGITVTIQDRIREQSLAAAESIDEWIDSFFENPKQFKAKGFDFKSHFASQGVTQAHARKIKSFYERDMNDLDDLINMPSSTKLNKLSEDEQDWCEQLKEGYSHISKADANKLYTGYQAIADACNMLIESSKATRKTRKPKAKSAEKQVEKVKYKKQDDKYSLVSVNPSNIIGANELWVFNVKTRKIGKYVALNSDPKGLAREGAGLTVKGTTIQGFDEDQSVQKTLRKPEEQLKEFKAAGKVALRKFLDTVNTTDTKLTGRINADTVLLKTN